MQYIRISDNDFCFARYDSAAGASSFTFNTYRLQPQMSVTANFREALSQVFFAAGSRVSTEILVAGTSVLVPLSEFQEEDCETIYGYCLPREEKCRVFYDTVPSANVVLLFSLPDALCRTLEDTLGSLRLDHRHVARRQAGHAPLVGCLPQEKAAVGANCGRGNCGRLKITSRSVSPSRTCALSLTLETKPLSLIL